MIIRDMEAADLPALRIIYLEARIKAFNWWNPDDIKLAEFDASTEGETVYVADSGHGIVGFISMRESNFIHNLFIDVNQQSKGVGKALIQYAFENFLKKPVRLKCTVRNTGGVGFYLANGWQIEQADVEHDPDPYHLFVFK